MAKDEIALYISVLALVAAGLSWWANARAADAAEDSADSARKALADIQAARRDESIMQTLVAAQNVVSIALKAPKTANHLLSSIQAKQGAGSGAWILTNTQMQAVLPSIGEMQMKAVGIVDAGRQGFAALDDEAVSNLLVEVNGNLTTIQQRLESWEADIARWDRPPPVGNRG